jgi:hypothetical protein
VGRPASPARAAARLVRIRQGERTDLELCANLHKAPPALRLDHGDQRRLASAWQIRKFAILIGGGRRKRLAIAQAKPHC